MNAHLYALFLCVFVLHFQVTITFCKAMKVDFLSTSSRHYWIVSTFCVFSLFRSYFLCFHFSYFQSAVWCSIIALLFAVVAVISCWIRKCRYFIDSNVVYFFPVLFPDILHSFLYFLTNEFSPQKLK